MEHTVAVKQTRILNNDFVAFLHHVILLKRNDSPWTVHNVTVGDAEKRQFEQGCQLPYFLAFFRDGIPSLSSSYKIPELVPACWLLFQCF